MHYNIVFPLHRLSEHSFCHFAFFTITPQGKTFFSQYMFNSLSLIMDYTYCECFVFFKLFNKCFIFLYFLAQAAIGLPDSVRRLLRTPPPVPRQQPSQSTSRSTRRSDRVYCTISQFTHDNCNNIVMVGTRYRP